jgi:hypothetical protein
VEKKKIRVCFTLNPITWRIISSGINEGGKIEYYRQTSKKSRRFSDELHY